MKKKIGELTLREKDEICKRSGRCVACIFAGNNGLCCEDLDKEIEVEG